MGDVTSGQVEVWRASFRNFFPGVEIVTTKKFDDLAQTARTCTHAVVPSNVRLPQKVLEGLSATGTGVYTRMFMVELIKSANESKGGKQLAKQLATRSEKKRKHHERNKGKQQRKTAGTAQFKRAAQDELEQQEDLELERNAASVRSACFNAEMAASYKYTTPKSPSSSQATPPSPVLLINPMGKKRSRQGNPIPAPQYHSSEDQDCVGGGRDVKLQHHLGSGDGGGADGRRDRHRDDRRAGKRKIQTAGFACQGAETGGAKHSDIPRNEACAEVCDEIAEIYKKRDKSHDQDDPYRANSWKRVADAFRRADGPVTEPSEVLGPTSRRNNSNMIQRLDELMDLQNEKPTCTLLENLRGEKTHDAIVQLTRVHGIGPTKARKIINDDKILTIEHLRNAHAEGRVTLCKDQIVGLKHLEDLEHRIPRAEVFAIGELVKEAAREAYAEMMHASLGSQANVDHRECVVATICGSFRRGRDSSGDVDVLLHPRLNDDDHIYPDDLGELLSRVLAKLTGSGFLVDHIKGDDTKHVVGKPDTYFGVCQLPHRYFKGHGGDLELPEPDLSRSPNSESGSPLCRRLDIKVFPQRMASFAMLYFTGSGHFNRSLRLLCKKADLKLSDQGLWKKDGSYEWSCGTEYDIFKALDSYFESHSGFDGGIQYVPPEKRECGGKMGKGQSGKSIWIQTTSTSEKQEGGDEVAEGVYISEERDTE